MFYRPEIARFGLLWFLTPKCNYHCPYCFDQEKRGAVQPWPWEECLAMLRRLAEQYGPLQVAFSGGEPTVHPQFFPLVRYLSPQGHVLFAATNLRVGAEPFLTSVANPDRFYMNASLHLTQTTVLAFYREVSMLFDAGFHVSASGVLYPPLLEETLAAQAFFRRQRPEIYFGGQVFFGTYQGQAYPAAYTARERALIEELAGVSVADREAKVAIPRERRCRAGQDFFVIAAEGEIFRCPGRAPLYGEYFPSFSLAQEALPCPLPECWCTDMYEFWED